MNVNTAASAPNSNQGVISRFEMDSEVHNIEQEKPDKWSISFEFLLAGIGYSVVFSTVWRFPYMMYANGGVLFLLPYINFLLLFGVPMFYLETCLGQFWGKGPFHIWKFCPLFRGLGISFVIMNAIYVFYTNPFLSWAVYYTALSLSYGLPWSTCDNAWNTNNCNDNYNSNNNTWSYASKTPGVEFFDNNLLQLSDGIGNLGSLRWELVGCMLAVTALMFAALFLGVKLTGKILYVVVPLPLFIMFVLFIRGITLPGGPSGVVYLLYPNFNRLSLLSTWTNAFTQAAYTMGVSNGVVQTLASYNNFKAPCLRYSFGVCIVIILFGLLAGLTLMSLIGSYAYLKGIQFEQVVNSGPGLIFVSVSESLSSLPAANFWCFIFFFMFLLMGITKQFLAMELFIRTIMDIIPHPSRVRRILVVGVVCCVSFIFTLPFLTQGGIYVLTLFDWYSWKITLPCFFLLECITVTWIYGLDQLSEDIKMMTGLRPPIVYKFLWAIVIPVFVLIIFIYWETENTVAMYGSYVFPEWTNRLGYFISVMPLFPIPVFAIIRLIRGRHLAPLDPDPDCRPDTDRWPEYNTKQRRMQRTVWGNLRAIFRS